MLSQIFSDIIQIDPVEGAITMKMYEYMGKSLLAEYGIPVPKGYVADSSTEAGRISALIGDSVIKAQILSGKRGKAGGIRFTENPEEAKQIAKELLGSKLLGMKTDKVLVEQKIVIDKEYYLAITFDGKTKGPMVLASTHGGVDIEEVPDEYMVKYPVDYRVGIMPFVAREITRRMKVSGNESIQIQNILMKLYKAFIELDIELIEINPLVVSEGKLIATDAKITIDDDALYRQKDIPYVEERTVSEKEAYDFGLAYVELDGDIGVIANGAGITLSTLDTISYYGGKAANFLDVGGGAGEAAISKALELVLERKPKVILVNVFGGITRCDDVANAFASAKKKSGIPIPIMIRLVGTNQERGREILEEAEIETFDTMHRAARKAVKLAGQRTEK